MSTIVTMNVMFTLPYTVVIAQRGRSWQLMLQQHLTVVKCRVQIGYKYSINKRYFMMFKVKI